MLYDITLYYDFDSIQINGTDLTNAEYFQNFEETETTTKLIRREYITYNTF